VKHKKLNDMYSTDDDFIYRYGVKRPEIDIKTFRLIGKEEEDCVLGIDKNSVYKFDGIIEGADPRTFEYIERCFFRDKESVYYAHYRLEKLDPETTRILNGMYIGDNDMLYSCDFHNVKRPFPVEPKANMEKIQVHGEWAYDDKTMYYAGEPIEGVNCNSIAFFDEYGFFKDDKAVYYQGSRLDDADPNSFQPIGNGYGKDEKRVYFFSERIEGADVPTFQAKGKMWGWGKDCDHDYAYGKRVNHSKAT
jgi:hypothetical protein